MTTQPEAVHALDPPSSYPPISYITPTPPSAPFHQVTKQDTEDMLALEGHFIVKYDVESVKVVKVVATNQGARFCAGVHTAENQKEVIGVSVAAAVTAWEAGPKIDALLVRRRT